MRYTLSRNHPIAFQHTRKALDGIHLETCAEAE